MSRMNVKSLGISMHFIGAYCGAREDDHCGDNREKYKVMLLITAVLWLVCVVTGWFRQRITEKQTIRMQNVSSKYNFTRRQCYVYEKQNYMNK